MAIVPHVFLVDIMLAQFCLLIVDTPMVRIKDDSEVSKRSLINRADIIEETTQLWPETENEGVLVVKKVNSYDVGFPAR